MHQLESKKEKVVEFVDVSKSFANLQALNSVTFNIYGGEIFALLGPNGAGKTTLISILTGLQIATKGNVRVLGYDVITDYRQARLNIGAVPQELAFDPFFNVREVLEFQSGYYGIKNNSAWIDELLHALHLQDKERTNTRKLSGGMKRRLMVAQALVHRPPVIVLDEPTTGVDVELRRELWRFITKLNKEGHTILLTTHYLQEAEELSTRIAMLQNGSIVALADKDELLKTHASQKVRIQTTPLINQESIGFRIQKEGVWQTIQIYEVSEVDEILQKIKKNNIKIEELQITPVDLEDVFLQIINNS